MRGREDTLMVQCGREISVEEIEQIQQTVNTFGRLSRNELARTICEHLGWYTHSGTYKEQACGKLLEKLEAEGVLTLPAKRSSAVRNKVPAAPRITPSTQVQAEIVGSLAAIGPVWLEVVRGREQTGLWDEYVCRYHYLGHKGRFGCYLRYFIRGQQGVLGCALFSGAAKGLGARDQWIGWTDRQRLMNLGLIVNNTRLLVLPWVRVRFLCSHVLGQVAGRIVRDWEQRWGYRPVLMETFVDPRYFEGTCYRAANWQYLGMTTGEGLVRKGRRYTTSRKRIFVKPLVAQWRRFLCSDRQMGRGRS